MVRVKYIDCLIDCLQGAQRQQYRVEPRRNICVERSTVIAAAALVQLSDRDNIVFCPLMSYSPTLRSP